MTAKDGTDPLWEAAVGSWTSGDALREAVSAGVVMAQAVRCARDMAGWAEKYPTLFSAKPIDVTLFNGVACANAFGSPGLTAGELRMVNRVCLWYFGLDWMVDHLATSRAEVDDIARRCLDVADGASPADGDELASFLAEIRDELAASPTYSSLRDVWRDELRRALDATAREWTWKALRAAGKGTPPTLDEYLENADNIGSAWINLSHWIAGGDRRLPEHLEELNAAGREVQKVLRLLNDLATYDRDLSWGDLNALMLGADRDEVTRHIALLVGRCRELILPLRARCPEQAEYLERQVGFSSGFYAHGDYWGTL
ncbi:hypothetical protein GCM10009780_39840 [Actinomadura alba]